jgi:hypothetical protein
LLPFQGVMRCRANAWSASIFSILTVVDEGEIDVMVLRLSANTKTPSLDTWEDDADKLAE